MTETVSPHEAKMPFFEHLSELSTCLRKSIIAVIVAAIFAFCFATELFAFLTAPLDKHFETAQLIGTGVAEAFIVKLKVSLVAGLIISSPYVFLQIWNFIAPGLYDNEKKHAFPFVALSTFCFLVGISFCYWVIFPFAFQFFLQEFASIGVNPTIRIGEYLAFSIKLILVFGVIFELPILSYFLTRLRVLNHNWLITKARFAIVAVFVVAAILTPPDIVTQVLLALPLIVLYGICILVSMFAERPANESVDKPTDLPSE